MNFLGKAEQKKKKEEYSNLLYIKLFSEAEAFLLLFP